MQRALVDRARRGDGEAFDALARTVGDRCMAIACSPPAATPGASPSVRPSASAPA